MTKQQLLNQGVKYNMKTFLEDIDSIIAQAKEDIKNNNVYETAEVFNELEEKFYRVQDNMDF